METYTFWLDSFLLGRELTLQAFKFPEVFWRYRRPSFRDAFYQYFLRNQSASVLRYTFVEHSS